MSKKVVFVKKKIGEIKKNNKGKFFYYLLVLALLSVIVFSVISLIKTNREIVPPVENGEEDVVDNDSCADCSYRLIDNKEVIREGEVNPFILAAVIDNHPDARPSFGLSSAEIVYDIPAEGGIDRYLALFAIDEEKEGMEIGPIRSARPYFLDIAKEYEALLLHCGGSPEALARISKEGLLSLNEFYNSVYYRRYPGYLAPHNILANFDYIEEYTVNRNLEKSVFSPWKFKNENNFNSDEAVYEIKVSNGQRQYDVVWNYDTDSDLYLRSLAGKKQIDNGGQEISASNLVFQFVDTEVLDSALRLKIETVGRGDATVCIDGSCIEGYWKKDDLDSRTKYYSNNDEEVVFNSGQTWIHFIDPSETELSY